MKYLTLAGEEVKWKLKNRPRDNASKHHKEVLLFIREIFPYAKVYEECKIPLGVGGKNLYFDIFLPEFSLAIEADGLQHNKFNAFFHSDIDKFRQQQLNDRIKERWCEVNNIQLIRISQESKPDEWRKQIAVRNQ